MRPFPVLTRLFARRSNRPARPSRRLRLGTLEDRLVPAFVINPIFDSTITNDPAAATIKATINQVIQAYENSFSDNITINIKFQEVTSGLAGSNKNFTSPTYSQYLTALTSHATTADDTAAVASLPTGSNNPVTNNTSIFPTDSLSRALGLPDTAPAVDGTISLNTSIMNLSRTGTLDATKYDLMAATAHEIDEVIGGGSAMDGQSNGATANTGIEPLDLFRYSGNGTRSYDTLLATNSYFSIDGGATNLVGFNQYSPGTGTPPNTPDFGDWFSNNGAGNDAPSAHVQDANNKPGIYDTLSVELRRLDVMGFTRVTTAAPSVTAGPTQTAVERQSATINLGTLAATSPNGPWGVTVNWGDGTTDPQFFVGSVGSLGTKSHTYAEEGPYTVTVTVTDFVSQSDTKTFTVNVSDPAVTPTGVPITAVEGAAFTGKTVATFTDPAGAEALADYSASINWGDGTPATAGAVSFSGGVFTVRGSHTYAEESGASPYDVTVTIHHDTAPDAVVHTAATVSDPAVIATGGFTVTAVEGADSGSQTVATFTDPGGAEPVGDYSASIDWGDGNSSAGTISFSGGVFTVSGSHTYAEESAADHAGSNPYDVKVTISHDTAPDAVVHTSATVSDPAVVTTGGFHFVVVEGGPSGSQQVASFTDPGGAEALGDYSASIDWGDGTAPSAGTITVFGGVFTVSGSHTYAVGTGTPSEFGNTFCDADPPSYHRPITVTISHEDAPTATAVSDAKISLKPGSAHLASDGSLIVVGTPGNDSIVINNVGGKTRTVTVQLGTAVLGTYTVGAGGRIVVAAMGGDDSVQVAAGITVQTVLYGGPGDDRLKGGGGRNILIGCEGDDTLTAGNLGDLMVGGLGADRLVGGNGNDLLVAGQLLDGGDNEDDRYDDLVAVLNARAITAPLHAADDRAVDKLTGGGGTDTFYYNFAGGGVLDIITDTWEIRFDV